MNSLFGKDVTRLGKFLINFILITFFNLKYIKKSEINIKLKFHIFDKKIKFNIGAVKAFFQAFSDRT